MTQRKFAEAASQAGLLPAAQYLNAMPTGGRELARKFLEPQITELVFCRMREHRETPGRADPLNHFRQRGPGLANIAGLTAA